MRSGEIKETRRSAPVAPGLLYLEAVRCRRRDDGTGTRIGKMAGPQQSSALPKKALPRLLDHWRSR